MGSKMGEVEKGHRNQEGSMINDQIGEHRTRKDAHMEQTRELMRGSWK